jgi:hypothetical protein
MRNEQRLRWAFVGFPLAGIASALVTIWGMWTPLGRVNPFGSLAFGVFLSGCFWIFLGLRSVWKTVVFIVVSVAAALISVLTGFLVAGKLGDNSQTYLPEILVGGSVGAFVIVLAAMLLLAPEVRLLRCVVKSACWGLAGSVLARIGMAAGPEFHALRMRLDPKVPDSDMSLIFVWQIGMAFVLALVFWTERKYSQAGAVELHRS